MKTFKLIKYQSNNSILCTIQIQSFFTIILLIKLKLFKQNLGLIRTVIY